MSDQSKQPESFRPELFRPELLRAIEASCLLPALCELEVVPERLAKLAAELLPTPQRFPPPPLLPPPPPRPWRPLANCEALWPLCPFMALRVRCAMGNGPGNANKSCGLGCCGRPASGCPAKVTAAAGIISVDMAANMGPGAAGCGRGW